MKLCTVNLAEIKEIFYVFEGLHFWDVYKLGEANRILKYKKMSAKEVKNKNLSMTDVWKKTKFSRGFRKQNFVRV